MKINCDMGESFGNWVLGNDEKIISCIDMANIACGMHASDPLVMQKTVQLAIQNNVLIGAHPGYPDLQGFGRRDINFSSQERIALILYQIGALQAIAQSAGGSIAYVKPHGALYNSMMKQDDVFISILKAISSYDPTLKLIIMAVPDYEKYQQMAKHYGMVLWFEAFVDRAYNDDGRLVPRSIEGSSYHSISQIKKQATELIQHQNVTSFSGKKLSLHADTLCIHGDNPLSLEVARELRGLISK